MRVLTERLCGIVALATLTSLTFGQDAVDVGSFTKTTTGAPTSQTIAHGLEVTPDLIILWTGAKTSESFGTDFRFAIGASDGTTEYSFASASQDGVTTSNASRRFASKAITIVDYGESLLAEADLTAWDSNDFTLSWTTNNATAYVIHFIAIGGTGIQAGVVNWQMPSSTGNVAVTGMGFQPDVVLHLNAGGLTAAAPSSQVNAALNLGAMDASGDEWSNTFLSVDGSGTATTQRAQAAGLSVVTITSSLTVYKLADFVSMDTDGFTVNFSTAGAGFANQVMSIDIKGMNAKAGTFTKSTGGAPASQSITGVEFEPELLLLSSVQNTTSGSIPTQTRFGFGASDGTTEGCTSLTDQDFVTTTNVDSIDKTSKIFVKANNNSQTIDAEADLTSFDSDGFTLNWTTNDAVATEICYLALVPFSSVAVRVEDVRAVASPNEVQVAWTTTQEIDNVGFHVYRERTGQRTRITRSLIPGSAVSAGPGLNLTAGSSYSVVDPAGLDGDRYWIEDLDLDGTRREHGPFVATRSASPLSAGPTLSPLAPNGGAFASPRAASLTTAPLGVRRQERELCSATSRDAATESQLARSPALVIGIEEEGVYRVTQEDWVSAGLSTAVDPRRLALFLRGEAIALGRSGGDDGSFDPGDSVEFYAHANPSPEERVTWYWLTEADPTVAMSTRGTNPSQLPTVSEYPETWIHRQRQNYFPALLNGADENFFGQLLTDTWERIPVAIPGSTRGPGDSTLSVTIQGIGAIDHQVEVLVDGDPIGVVECAGSTRGSAQFSLPTTPATFEVALRTSGATDFAFLESFTVDTHQAYEMTSSPWFFEVPGNSAALLRSIPGDARIIDITDPTRAEEVETLRGGATATQEAWIETRGLTKRKFVAFTNARAPQRLRRNQASAWRERQLGSEFVIVAPEAFHDALAPLVRQRQADGISTALVRLEDAYDEFSGGARVAVALRHFLRESARSWRVPPKYLLLVGDATYDPREYLGPSPPFMLPTLRFDSRNIETASDAQLGDLDGDGIPEVAIGRFPAATTEEVEALVRKTLLYSQRQGRTTAYRNVAIGVSDADDTFPFGASIDGLAGSLSTFNWRMRDRNLDGAAELTGAIAQDLNEGVGIVVYFGHGGTRSWSADSFWDAERAGRSRNHDREAIVVSSSCLNGYFHHPSVDSLAESWLKVRGGAVAVLASTAFANPYRQRTLTREWLVAVANGARLGDAWLAAQSAALDRATRSTTVLLGDPTLTMAR